ncbi:hypothetical protein SHIRM173S_09784 [Streptomyces hirsutus]
MTFALQAEVLFGKDSAKLSSQAKARIGAIAEEIKKQNATRIRVSASRTTWAPRPTATSCPASARMPFTPSWARS